MKIKDILKEQWNPDNPISSLVSPPDWYDRSLIKKLENFNDIKNSSTIDNYDAELLIAANDTLTKEIQLYRYSNTPLSKNAGNMLVDIMKRIQPVDKTFYRGVEFDTQDEKHIMPVQSWATSVKVAKYFGDIIYKTVGTVKGVELSSIFYINETLYDHESNGLTESMGEWLLLDPRKEIMDRK